MSANMNLSTMLNKAAVFLIIGIGLTNGQCPTTPDPCTAYEEIDDTSRSTGVQYDGTISPDFLTFLEPAWYRSVGVAGGDMPTEPPSLVACNALAQIWLDGVIPAADNQVHTVRACTKERTNNCVREHQLQVKNCGTYRVYCLSATRRRAARYCMGNEAPCGEGETSPTGFTPNCIGGNDLTLTGDPEITVGIEYESTVIPNVITLCRPYYEFKCNVEHDDNTVFLDVQWFADEELVQEQVGDDAIAYADLPAILNSDDLANLEFVLGTTITCRVAARASQSANANVGLPKEFDFFAGVTVAASSQFIELIEGGGPGTYTGRYTLPYRCEFHVAADQQCSDDLHECRHGLDIGVVKVDSQNGGCPATGDVTLEIPSGSDRAGCIVSSNEFDFSVQVHPNPDHVYNPRREMVLEFQVLPSNPNFFWAGARLPRAVVAINDTDAMLGGKHCVISDDPHQQSFDGQIWTEVQLEGVFLMYRHKTLPISVEVYFKKHANGYFTYNCGGAVRSGGQAFVFDACRDDGPTRVTLYECDEGLQQMTVTERSPTSYEILLPTGTRVILGKSRQYVYPSIFDWEQTEGLCGNFNGIDTPEDDKVVRGTDIVDYGTPNPRWPTRLDHNVFSNSYRIPEEETLYFGYVTDDAEYNNLYFCQCTGDNADPGAECSVTPNVDCLAGDHPGANGFSHRCTLARRRRATNVVTGQEEEPPANLFPFNPEFTTGTGDMPGNWNEGSALAHCNRLFRANTNAQACMLVPNLNIANSVGNCVADILMTGSTALDRLHILVFIELCKAEAEKFDFESEGDNNLPITPEDVQDIIKNICPDACSGHGACVDGVCRCSRGFAGVSCSIDLRTPPVIRFLSNNGTCDLKHQPCDEVAVYGGPFLKDSIQCRLRFTDGRGGRQNITRPGSYVHSEKVLCPLLLADMKELEIPPPQRFPFLVTIAVSNGGLFSDEKVLTILDTRIEEPICQSFHIPFLETLDFDIINNGDGRVLIRTPGIEAPLLDLGFASVTRVTVDRNFEVTVCPRQLLLEREH